MSKLAICCIIVIGRNGKHDKEKSTMSITVAVLSIFLGVSILLNLASISTAIFLGRELIKKFDIIWQFASSASQYREYTHIGTKNPGMQNIMLASKHGQPFTALVGLKLRLPLSSKIRFDPFLVVQSDERGNAVFRTFLGTSPCRLLIVANGLDPTEIIIITGDRADLATPTVTARPHWFQR